MKLCISRRALALRAGAAIILADRGSSNLMALAPSGAWVLESAEPVTGAST